MTDGTRIECLENQVRTLKRMCCCVLGFALVGGLLASTAVETVPDVIQAKKFELVNDDGKVRARIFLAGGMENPGAMFQMFDEEGVSVIQISSNGAGGQLEFFNGDGKNTVSLNTRGAGGSLSIRNVDGRRAARLDAGSHGGGELEFRNMNGQPVAGIGADGSGDGLFRLGNRKGEITTSLP